MAVELEITQEAPKDVVELQYKLRQAQTIVIGEAMKTVLRDETNRYLTSDYQRVFDRTWPHNPLFLEVDPNAWNNDGVYRQTSTDVVRVASKVNQVASVLNNLLEVTSPSQRNSCTVIIDQPGKSALSHIPQDDEKYEQLYQAAGAGRRQGMLFLIQGFLPPRNDFFPLRQDVVEGTNREMQEIEDMSGIKLGKSSPILTIYKTRVEGVDLHSFYEPRSRLPRLIFKTHPFTR